MNKKTDMHKKFERLKELESQKNRMMRFFKENKAYPHLVLSTIPAKRDSFYEQTDESKWVHGIPRILDIPDDLGIEEILVAAINKRYDSIIEEYNELLSD